MLRNYLFAAAVIGGLAALWVRVQLAWRASFPEVTADVDVLAARPSCEGCHASNGCDSTCESPPLALPRRAKEEKS